MQMEFQKEQVQMCKTVQGKWVTFASKTPAKSRDKSSPHAVKIRVEKINSVADYNGRGSTRRAANLNFSNTAVRTSNDARSLYALQRRCDVSISRSCRHAKYSKIYAKLYEN
jgi:hypothetical protein